MECVRVYIVTIDSGHLDLISWLTFIWPWFKLTAKYWCKAKAGWTNIDVHWASLTGCPVQDNSLVTHPMNQDTTLVFTIWEVKIPDMNLGNGVKTYTESLVPWPTSQSVWLFWKLLKSYVDLVNTRFMVGLSFTWQLLPQ